MLQEDFVKQCFSNEFVVLLLTDNFGVNLHAL